MKHQNPSRVKFRHPETGEEQPGHLSAVGHKGATVLDQTGKAHRVPHGHYLHEDAKLDPDMKKVEEAARRHLELGPGSRVAVLAAAALLAIGGVDRVTTLRAQDLRISAKGDAILLHGPRLRVVEPATLVAVLSVLARGAQEAFAHQGRAVTPQELEAYFSQFGAKPKPAAGTPAAPASKPLQKAVASALRPVRSPPPLASWTVDGFRCSYRQNDRGIGMLTIQHSSMPLAFHEVMPNAQKAREVSRQYVKDLKKGKVPPKGIFARTDA